MAADATTRRFSAMGSDAHLIVTGGPSGLVDRLVVLVDELEQRWSRFLPDSEVSELNRRGGDPCVVHPTTVVLVRRAVEAWRLTGGSFDPTVLGDVLRAGYGHSLVGRLDGLAGEQPAGTSDLVIGCTDIAVDDANGTVTMPAGTGFDPGGIGKGLAADLVVEAATDAGATGICVNLGGDLRLTGTAPGGGSWHVAIEHPDRPSPVAHLDLADGAVATSTTRRRRWTSNGAARHHLIDPASGAPSDTDVELMTVIASSGWQAETLATACLLRGADRAFDLLDHGTHGLLVTTSGELRQSVGLTRFRRHDAGALA